MNKRIYVIIFSSFYKAAYAQDVLSNIGIKSTIKKAPSELSMNCSYALYISFSKTDLHNNISYNTSTESSKDVNYNTSYDILSIARILKQSRLPYNNIYQLSGKKYERLRL